MIHIMAERLEAVVADVFVAAGTPIETAREVAATLVEGNLTGHDSHGVLRVTFYVDMIRNGRLDPRGELTVVHESATTALLDGGKNFGPVTARKAMDYAMTKAREHDLGMVAIRNCGHTGRLGQYAVQAAKAGFMGMVFSFGSVKGGTVAPYLGTGRTFNTNPIAWAVPAAAHQPVFMDYATSVVAQGKIQAAVDKGVRIPEGWLLDAEGNPTTDPAEQMRGGVMLPFGGHKGYCLAFMIEVLSGGLTGAGCSALPAFKPDFPTVMLAVNIAAFQPLEQFCQMVDELIAVTKAGRKAPGVEEILVPGEPEWRAREKGLRDGLDLPEATWQRIVDAGAKCGLEVVL